MSRIFAVAAFALLLSAHTGLAQEQRRDSLVFQDVARKVTAYSRFTVFDDIQASVDSGVVTLSGKVTMPFKRTDIERQVSEVPGVVRVVNRIAVLPVSQFDDELRLEIARAIYGNPSFWRYASMANPPIHIVVENGRVTLTGVVSNDMDRMLARSLAAGFNSFGVDNQLKTEAEMRSELEKIRN